MGLPKIDHPTFDLTVPSTQENIKYRPFLVKEEKILLMAQESGQPNVFVDAITQVLNNCVVDYDVSKLTSFDTEYLFLKLRANSVSDLAKVNIYDDETENYEEVEVDLNSVECALTEQESLIKLNDLVAIEMRYPSYDDLMGMEADSGLETSLEMISRCIDKVYNDEETLDMKDFTQEEQEEFINSFPADAFAQIQKYFEDMPKVSMEVKYKIKVDGKQKTKKKVLQGINDFFS
tara:strand:+ start:806 stop:1507 length:702 start_codon:yes stop_codon:yes gene_type:complete